MKSRWVRPAIPVDDNGVPVSVRTPDLEAWMAEVEYLATPPEAGYAHDHPGCAWRPYAEYYDAHGMGNRDMSRADMFCDLTYALAFLGPSRHLPEGIGEQVVAAFVAGDSHDGADPFMPTMDRVRAIQALLGSD